MQYRVNPKNGDKLSILGFGCMRFPKDEKETEKLILTAIANGVNYFDTAYIYGASEETLGRILQRNKKRSDVFIATKIPPALVKKPEDMDKLFQKQLERLQTDYIDYYLIHMVTDAAQWARIDALGAGAWLRKMKAEGKIRSFGFSYHGGKEEFVTVCDAFDWEFCLIQYNYVDENNQAGQSGLRHAADKGLPVMIMEPLRGGALANNLPKRALNAFTRAAVNRSPAEWSFRWLWNQPEVTCVLSGMNNPAALAENLAAASNAAANSFTTEEHAAIAEAKAAVTEAIKVPCTGCGYCMPCPRGVDIPTCLSCYNSIVLEGKNKAQMKYIMQTSLKAQPQNASRCTGCGACEKHCPQKIEIRKALKDTSRTFEKFWFKPMAAVAKWFMRL